MTLASYQKALTQFVYDENPDPLKDYLKPYDQQELVARLNVHQNNTIQSLVNVLVDSFESVVNTIGEDLFRVAARHYARQTPLTGPVLLNYGRSFPQFLAKFEPTSSFHYLEGLATVDVIRECSYNAMDQTPVAAEDFAEIGIDALIEATVLPVESANIYASNYAIFDIWQLAHGETEAEVDAETPQAVLSIRPFAEVNLFQLDWALYCFFDALRNRHTINQALESASEVDHNFNPAQAITFLIHSGFTAQILTTGESQ